MTRNSEFAVGDYVVLADHVDSVHQGKVFRIEKINPKTLRLADPGNPDLTAAPSLLRPATAAQAAKAKAAEADTPAPLYLGSLVKLSGKPKQYVIIGLPNGRSDLYKAAVLGGNDNRFQRAPRTSFTLVAPESIRAA